MIGYIEHSTNKIKPCGQTGNKSVHVVIH